MSETVHTMSLNLEVYLKGRADPLFWPMRIDVSEDVTEVGDIMLFAYNRIREILNDISEPHLLLIDERFSYHVIMKEDIQAFSIGAPDQSSITWGDNDE